jgi:hypothetical protein
MSNKRHKKAKSHKLRSSGIRGIERAEHYAAGMTPQQYRGVASITKNKQKIASKEACHKPENNDD